MTRREFGFALAAVGVREEPIRAHKAWLQEQIEAKVIPGVKVLAVWKDKPVVELFLGTYCDQRGPGQAVEAKAIHPLASFSKMVTATAVMTAWQDGLIDLDAPVAKYIPEFAAHGKDKVTVRMCLNHSAGIPTSIPGKWMDTEEHWDETLALVCAKEPEWEPGTRTQYHGSTGPMVAAAVVRRQSGNRSWHSICRERIFAPLGLDSFTFVLPPPERSAVLYGPPKDPAAGAAQYRGSVNNPGGGMMGTAGDILKFLRFHTRGGVWNGKHLLGERYWNEMHTNQFAGKPAPEKDKPGYESWGLGMMVRSDKGLGSTTWLGSSNAQARRVFSHAGISTVLGVGDPDAELEIAILTTDVPRTPALAGEIRRRSIDAVYAAIG